jgi:hypothetical protein
MILGSDGEVGWSEEERGGARRSEEERGGARRRRARRRRVPRGGGGWEGKHSERAIKISERGGVWRGEKARGSRDKFGAPKIHVRHSSCPLIIIILSLLPPG